MSNETPEAFLKRIGQFPQSENQRSTFQKRVRERLDYVCQRALAEGKYGVKVVTNTTHNTTSISVSDEVPYGEIQYHEEH